MASLVHLSYNRRGSNAVALHHHGMEWSGLEQNTSVSKVRIALYLPPAQIAEKRTTTTSHFVAAFAFLHGLVARGTLPCNLTNGINAHQLHHLSL